MSQIVLVSGGAGYIGSHACYALREMGFTPVVLDDLSTGNLWATANGLFEKGDIGDVEFVTSLCRKYNPIAAMHFAAFIEVGESVTNPAKYFTNNRDKASQFFKTLMSCGVRKIVFSSTAAVYGETGERALITETEATRPINPYGQSKLEAESFLRMLDAGGMRSATLRYFNVAGAAPTAASIGEAHTPETHLIPRLILPLIGVSPEVLDALGLKIGFTIYGNDYDTPDGTAIRDYIHVMDLANAHVRALDYLLSGGETTIFNLGSGTGYSVAQIVEVARALLNRPHFSPAVGPRRQGDPAVLVASNAKAHATLGWQPTRSLKDIIADAVTWHSSSRYVETMRQKLGLSPREHVYGGAIKF